MMLNRRRLLSLVFLLCLLAQPLQAQETIQEIPPDLRQLYESAYFAWDRGDYVESMQYAEALLTAPDAELLVDQVAQLTGEVYHVEELAPDGSAVQWGPDGQYATFEVELENELHTRVLSVNDQVEHIATVEGGGAAFSPDRQQLAYIRIPETAELEAAREAEARALADRNIPELRRLRAQIEHLEAEAAQLSVLDLESREESTRPVDELALLDITYAPDGRLIASGWPAGEREQIDLFALEQGVGPERLTDGPQDKGRTLLFPGEDHLIYSFGEDQIVVRDVRTGDEHQLDATSPAVSADGSMLVYLTDVQEPVEEIQRGEAIVGADVRSDGMVRAVNVLPLDGDAEPREVRRTTLPLSSPAVSPSGNRVAYMMMLRDSWEIFVSPTDEPREDRLTREIQHEYFPGFLTDDRLFTLMGEARHRRAYLYDLNADRTEVTAEWMLPGRDQRGRTQLFHNNTLRTVAPQYEWEGSPDGSRMLVVADRDGDTVSPERGVYLVDMNRPVTRAELLERVRRNLAAEQDLRDRGADMFEAIEDEVRAATAEVDVGRIYDYAHALYQFGPKWFDDPGNQQAIQYLAAKFEEMGYEPELQWFEPRPGTPSANVVATLPGTTNPEQVYLITSHFDSVPDSPGADDNSSGTTAMLEAARVLAERPQAATIKFVLLTAEEAGLLGAYEYVRRAQEEGEQVAGVINNDMIGWTRSHRLDNTIRYSNAGIRDIQHNAAIQFSDLITYDARYVRGTDAFVFFEAYGDILGGTGSYPILSNPHYHQPHDMLEVIDQRLVAEVSRTTVAAIMRLASSPQPVADLQVQQTAAGAHQLTWSEAREQDVSHYLVTYGPEEEPDRITRTVEQSEATLDDVQPGWEVSITAVTDAGITGWDEARVTVPEGEVASR